MLFFTSRRRVGCLGKLPVAPDFDLESRIGGGAEEALSAWLRAIPGPEPGGTVRKEEDTTGRNGFAFILFDPRMKDAIAGRLWPSRDSAGRTFPFALYAALDGKARRESILKTLNRSIELWRRLDGLARAGGRYWADPESANSTDLHSIRKALKEFRIDADRDLRISSETADLSAKARSLELWSFLESLHPGETGRRFPETFARFAKFARNFDGTDHPAVGLRVSAGEGEPIDLQTAFWLGWLEALIGRPAPRPEVFIAPYGEGGSMAGGSLWILYRGLLPQDGEVILGSRRSHEFLFDLAEMDSVHPEETAADPGLLEKLKALKTAGELFEQARGSFPAK